MTKTKPKKNKSKSIRDMFSAIAPGYDLLNHLLSINLDRSWRKRAIRLASPQPDHNIIDICCGSGDMALEFVTYQPQLAQITGVDFSENMLKIARKKTEKLLKTPQKPSKNTNFSPSSNHPQNQRNHYYIQWLCADAQHIPLPEEHFDIASCAFGIRNVKNPQLAINQAFRLLKPGGKMVILEFALPDNLFVSWCYQYYFRLVLPLLAGIISAMTNNSSQAANAYRYLPASVCNFHAEKKLEQLLHNAGFVSVKCENLNFRTVLLYLARKP